jgi:hypothetical protein
VFERFNEIMMYKTREDGTKTTPMPKSFRAVETFKDGVSYETEEGWRVAMDNDAWNECLIEWGIWRT